MDAQDGGKPKSGKMARSEVQEALTDATQREERSLDPEASLYQRTGSWDSSIVPWGVTSDLREALGRLTYHLE